MKQERVIIAHSKEENAYYFTSTGLGNVSKKVKFEEMIVPGRFNLALSDIINKQEDYDNVSNNRDHLFLASAMLQIVEHFLITHPSTEIFFTGSTPARTRLYRMKLALYLELIEDQYLIQGLPTEDGNFELFDIGKDYVGFLISKKKA